MPSDQRSYSAGHFAIEIEGGDAGIARSVVGGEPYGIVAFDPPVGARVGKHLDGVGYEPIVIELSGTLHPRMLSWVASMLDGTQTAHDGAIAFLDYDYRVRSELRWTGGMITQVDLPAADGSLRESVAMSLTIEPASVVMTAGSGARHSPTMSGGKQKANNASDFRFVVSGLEAACTRVSKVASLSIRQRDVLEVPNLTFWVSEITAAAFDQWRDEFVLHQGAGAAVERSAELHFLNPTRTSDVFSITMSNVGVVRVARERAEAGSEVVAWVRVEAYCEDVRLVMAAAEPPPPAGAPPAPPAAAPTADDALEALTTALIAALRRGATVADRTPDAIAARLMATVDASTPAPTDDIERGRAAGRAWAAEHAHLDELQAIAPLAGRDDWSAMALTEGHSLAAFLAASGVLEGGVDPVDLRRDEFTEGIAEGAAEVLRIVAPQLTRRPALIGPRPT